MSHDVGRMLLALNPGEKTPDALVDPGVALAWSQLEALNQGASTLLTYAFGETVAYTLVLVSRSV